MPSSLARSSGRLAVLIALSAALGLGACGRKGPLDLPPGASAPAPGPAPEDVLKFGVAPASPAGPRGD